ncbi:hypothetical protein [Fulvivirga ligni]|uniref:hypothetical protein n=1 Tax=Fulvivirga ligni TaxID=2904246 RepID=UPI001F2D8EA5|nr:hypothetical protein [Fulvivirga ligni]UII23623.1 hypothetical protein LVD16_10325 [Fulvivirga ligni]
MKPLALTLLLLIQFSAFSQSHLTVRKQSNKVKEEFFIDDVIAFKLKGDKDIYTGKLNAVKAESNEIVVEQAKVDVSEIEVIYSQESFNKNFHYKLLTAGVLLPFLDRFNETVINDQKGTWNPGVLIASGVLISTAFAIKYLKKRKYKIGKRFKLSADYF